MQQAKPVASSLRGPSLLDGNFNEDDSHASFADALSSWRGKGPPKATALPVPGPAAAPGPTAAPGPHAAPGDAPAGSPKPPAVYTFALCNLDGASFCRHGPPSMHLAQSHCVQSPVSCQMASVLM